MKAENKERLKKGDKLYTMSGNVFSICKIGRKYYHIDDGDKVNKNTLKDSHSFNSIQYYTTSEEVSSINFRAEAFRKLRVTFGLLTEKANITNEQLKRIIKILDENK